jgi:hypothetical protein
MRARLGELKRDARDRMSLFDDGAFVFGALA